jgi:hypothetical protein
MNQRDKQKSLALGAETDVINPQAAETPHEAQDSEGWKL